MPDDNTCDAGASARALVWWWNPDLKSEWKFCAHHSHEHEAWMLRTGHSITRDLRAELEAETREHEPA